MAHWLLLGFLLLLQAKAVSATLFLSIFHLFCGFLGFTLALISSSLRHGVRYLLDRIKNSAHVRSKFQKFGLLLTFRKNMFVFHS